MKNVILILGILTTVLVCGVVAGVSTNASPPELYMDLSEDECRFCHVGNLQGEHHPFINNNSDKCCYCHLNVEDCLIPKNINDQINNCGSGSDSDNNCHDPDVEDSIGPVTDHHDFTEIFDDDWDCLICHEKGVPRPLDK